MNHHLRSRPDRKETKEFHNVFSETTDNKTKPDDDDNVKMTGGQRKMMTNKRFPCFTSCKLLFLLAVYTFQMHIWAQFTSSSGLMVQTKSLLGILLVGKSDVYTLQDWLHRHVELFDKLVVIDGSESEWARDLIQSYNDNNKDTTSATTTTASGRIHWLSEASLNLSIVSDQSLRAPAMSILGNPVGKWIMICHPDEFWVMDPRLLIDRALKQNNKDNEATINLIRPNVMWASPFESTYQETAQLLDGEPELLYNGSFHIQQVCNMTFHRKAPSGLNHAENRLFQWQDGMKWGTHKHGLVVPEFINQTANYEDYVRFHFGFYIHFKLHDFSKTAIRKDGYGFANSKLKTGVHNHSDTEGWMGKFLDLSFPDALKKYPPRSLDRAIQQECRAWKYRSMCSLPWNVNAKFIT